MSLPKINPFKVWTAGGTVYNDIIKPGMTKPAKFFQKWKLTDTIRHQIITTDARSYVLKVINAADDSVLGSVAYETTIVGTNYVHNASFTLSGLGITSDLRFYINVYETENTISGNLNTPAFTASGNVTFLFSTFELSGSLTMASFTATGAVDNQAAVLSFELEIVAIGATQAWTARFDYTDNYEDLTGIGNGATDSANIPTAQTTVTVSVWKTSNGGIAQDAGNVNFEKNGGSVNTQTFNNLDNVGVSNAKQYIYNGLIDGDTLKVIVTEG